MSNVSIIRTLFQKPDFLLTHTCHELLTKRYANFNTERQKNYDDDLQKCKTIKILTKKL